MILYTKNIQGCMIITLRPNMALGATADVDGMPRLRDQASFLAAGRFTLADTAVCVPWLRRK